VKRCHEAGKTCALILPQIFRLEAERYFKKYREELRTAGFDAFVLRSMEEVGFLREAGLEDVFRIFDANLYVLNRAAAGFMQKEGAGRLTLPLELNSRELEELGCGQKELIAYGYLPVMVSAQCIRKTTSGCTKQPGLLHMKDRTGKELAVKNQCRFCCNTIYNPSPLSLLGQEKLMKRLSPSVLRLQFTMERPDQIREIIQAYADHFLHGLDTPSPCRDFTRGHMKRGVE
jgi:putative protease